MPTYAAPTVLFSVQLLGMPEVFSARRQALIHQFQDEVIALYGSEDAAGAALHAYLDSGDLEAGELPWEDAHARVVATMGLPPGARFSCSIAGLHTAGFDPRSGQPVQPYAVHLQEAAALPSAMRVLAEQRYMAALNHALGGPDAAAAVYRAWLAANESEPNALDADTMTAAMRWPRAAGKAQEAGMHKLGELPGAHFEVRLARG